MPRRLSLHALLVASLLVAVESPEAAERALERFHEFLDNGDRAVRDGRCASAEDWYLDAVREADTIDPRGPQVVGALTRLVEVYRLQGAAGRSRAGAVLRRLKSLAPAVPEAAAAVARWEADASMLAAKPTSTAKPGPTEADYLETLRAHIQVRWVYPNEAGQKGVEGDGTVYVAIRRDGHLHASRITRSTGVPVLDQAMLDAIRVTQPLPALPDAIAQDPFEITLEFRYQVLARPRSAQRPAVRPPDPAVTCR